MRARMRQKVRDNMREKKKKKTARNRRGSCRKRRRKGWQTEDTKGWSLDVQEAWRKTWGKDREGKRDGEKRETDQCKYVMGKTYIYILLYNSTERHRKEKRERDGDFMSCLGFYKPFEIPFL